VQNVGAGVGFTIMGDMDATALTLTQKTAGALTITSNVVEASEAAADQQSDASIVASNATSLNLVFNNSNIDKLTDGFDNRASITVKAGVDGSGGATAITIASNGTEVDNYAHIIGAKTSASTAADSLTSITVTGSNHLNLDYTVGTGGALKLATVDASGQTDGGLTFNLGQLTAGGTIKLGAGDDVLTARTFDTTGITAASSLTIQTVSGLEKAGAVDQTAQDGFDVITITAAVQAADHDAASAGAYSIKDGVYTLGSGVTSLAGAVAQIATNLTTDGATVVFNYSGTNYIYSEGATAAATNNDVLIKLVGVTGITGLDDDGAGHIYLVG
jgi:hypothetical protein